MPIDTTEDAPPSSPPESLTDPESHRGRDTVEFHEDREVVDAETFETVAELGNLAPVGVTNDDGEVLLCRITETCARKVPTAGVEPGEDYAAAARAWVAEQAGVDVELDSIVGAWHYEAEHEDDPDRVAERYFVVFGASPVDEAAAIPDDHEAEAADWYAEFPDDAVRAPGTDRFFD